MFLCVPNLYMCSYFMGIFRERHFVVELSMNYRELRCWWPSIPLPAQPSLKIFSCVVFLINGPR